MISTEMFLRYLGIEYAEKYAGEDGRTYYIFFRSPSPEMYYQSELPFHDGIEEKAVVLLGELNRETREKNDTALAYPFFSGLFSSDMLGELLFWILGLTDSGNEKTVNHYHVFLEEAYDKSGQISLERPVPLHEGFLEATSLIEAKRLLVLDYLLEKKSVYTSEYAREVVNILLHIQEQKISGWSVRSCWSWRIQGKLVEKVEEEKLLLWRK